MKATLAPAVSSSPKVGAHSPDSGHPADTDTALGFLAELAAAIGAVGPLGQQLSVPTQQPGKPGGSTGADEVIGSTPTSTTATATALPTALPGSPATALITTAISPLLIPSRQGTATPDATTSPVASTAASPVTAAGRASLGSDSTIPPTAGTPLPQAAIATAMPVEVTAAERESRSANHHAKPATTAASADPAPATSAQPATTAPGAADSARTTDSAAAGIDPLSAAAASTSTAPTPAPVALSAAVATGDGTQQTTAVLRQVFPEVTRVSTTPGTHRLAITLHPDDLGEVRVTVVVRGDSVRVNVATDPTSGVARTALEHGAPELRRLLEATGTNARVEFRDLGAGTGTGLGTATDSGRQQSQTSAQAQSHAQSDAQSQSQSQSQPQSQGGGHGHRQQLGQAPPAPGPIPTVAKPIATQTPTAPTARTAAPGLDQLI